MNAFLHMLKAPTPTCRWWRNSETPNHPISRFQKPRICWIRQKKTILCMASSNQSLVHTPITPPFQRFQCNCNLIIIPHCVFVLEFNNEQHLPMQPHLHMHPVHFPRKILKLEHMRGQWTTPVTAINKEPIIAHSIVGESVVYFTI